MCNHVQVNEWADVLGNAIVGLLFMEENLTGDMLERTVVPFIILELESQIDVEGNLEEDLLQFPQDRALPHYCYFVGQ